MTGVCLWIGEGNKEKRKKEGKQGRNQNGM